ncbi:MAG: S8 family peptidase [Pseudomonadota bacterium]
MKIFRPINNRQTNDNNNERKNENTIEATVMVNRTLKRTTALALAIGFAFSQAPVGSDSIESAKTALNGTDAVTLTLAAPMVDGQRVLTSDVVSYDAQVVSLTDDSQHFSAVAATRTTPGADVAAKTIAESSHPLERDAVSTLTAAQRVSVASVKMSAPVLRLAEQGGNELVDLMVRYEQHPEMFDDDRVAALGGEVLRSYESFEMRAIRLPASAIVELALEDSVDWLSEDGNVMSTSIASRQAANLPSFQSANRGYNGNGIGVAVVDTGVDVSGDLEAGIVQFDFSGGKVPTAFGGGFSQSSARIDEYGHGTHVAAIIAARASNTGLAEGTATGAKIISLKVLDKNGKGSASDVVAAMDWVLANRHMHNIRVVNLSLGMGVQESATTDPMVLAAERLWDAGIVVVAAAGNDGYRGNMTINSPGNSRKVITVGSVTDSGTGTFHGDDYVSSFSSMGPTVGDLVLKPDLLAPGNKIVAVNRATSELVRVLPSGRIKGCNGSGCGEVYLEMSGTSMSAPMVSAAVARMLQRNPNLTPSTIKARLMRTARKLSDEPTAAGAGVLDVDRAMNAGGHVHGQALSPLMVRDDATGDIYIEDTGSLWGSGYWASGYIYSGGFDWAEGVAPNTLGDLSANGFLWTDSGVWSRGFMWTDEDTGTGGSVWSRGFMWTDEDGGTGARSLMENDGGVVRINDDP